MEIIHHRTSVFAQIVDKLRTKSDPELKLLYMQFFKDDFTSEWDKLTSETDFSDVTDEEIINIIMSKRYKPAQ